MAADLPTLQARLDALKSALATGEKSVSYDNRRVDYRDIAEIQKAIAAVEKDIFDLGGSGIVRQYRFTSDKGL